MSFSTSWPTLRSFPRACPGYWHKQVFEASGLEFVGQQMSIYKIRPAEFKVNAVCEFSQRPPNRRVRDTLGFLNFHERFIPVFTQLLGHLTESIKLDVAEMRQHFFRTRHHYTIPATVFHKTFAFSDNHVIGGMERLVHVFRTCVAAHASQHALELVTWYAHA